MKQKINKCLYCEKEMDSITTRKRFCSDKCRVYWNREHPKAKVADLTHPTGVLKPHEQPASNYTINSAPSFLDTPESFTYELQNATSPQQMEAIGKRIEKSKLSYQVRQQLHNLGKHIYNEKFNF